MLFFYIRHGEPIYNPDSLTELGKKQAEALSKRLSFYGLDRIYASTSNRAIMTAQPTCDLLRKEATLLDFCNEGYAWGELTVVNEHGRRWLFEDEDSRQFFATESTLRFSHRWYEHPRFQEYNYQKGIERVYNEMDKLFLSLGYEHERYSGRYKVITPNRERVALFAHKGFGSVFLSCLLDIPYPQVCMYYDMWHTGMTVIEFPEANGYTVPKILTLSSDSHMYREGLPTNYNYIHRF